MDKDQSYIFTMVDNMENKYIGVGDSKLLLERARQ